MVHVGRAEKSGIFMVQSQNTWKAICDMACPGGTLSATPGVIRINDRYTYCMTMDSALVATCSSSAIIRITSRLVRLYDFHSLVVTNHKVTRSRLFVVFYLS